MTRSPRLAALLLALALTGCGGGGSSPKAEPTTPSPTPSPTPTLPPLATDQANAKAALVTAKELGAPFVEPKGGKVNEVKHAKDELCPGHKSEYALFKPRTDPVKRMTEGTKQGAGIVSFAVRVYGLGQEQQWRDAADQAEKACASWKAAEGNYVTLEMLTSPPPVPGADETRGHVERVWADAKHTQLQYVRHYFEARTGRVVSTLEYAYLVPKTDPTGKDTRRTVALLAKQVAKTKRVFGLA
ncbi:MAG TPA: hypothetical protein VFQ85_12305 [Mycobacteriales bacterium]|jgi:hypothetical protein|nr:hypothetical protein [Mycobacteriales bacterium]